MTDVRLIEQVPCTDRKFDRVINIVSGHLSGHGVVATLDCRAIVWAWTVDDVAEAITRGKKSSDRLSLDLIGHFAEEKLVIGSWEIDSGNELAGLATELEDYNFTTVRLLGCKSGGNSGVLNKVAAALPKFDVLGTTLALDATYFDAAGFRCAQLNLLKLGGKPKEKNILSMTEGSRKTKYLDYTSVAALERGQARWPAHLRAKIVTLDPARFDEFAATCRGGSNEQFLAQDLLALPEIEVVRCECQDNPCRCERVRWMSLYAETTLACVNLRDGTQIALVDPSGQGWSSFLG